MAHGASIVLLLAVACALAWALRIVGDQPIVYDADVYIVHAKILATGPIEVWGFRTYGYPAFLVPWVVLAGRDQDLLKLFTFVAQVVVHLAAAWLFARRVAGALDNETLGRLTLVLVALNPFLLLMTSPLLSDLLSTALVITGIGMLPQRNQRPAEWSATACWPCSPSRWPWRSGRPTPSCCRSVPHSGRSAGG